MNTSQQNQDKSLEISYIVGTLNKLKDIYNKINNSKKRLVNERNLVSEALRLLDEVGNLKGTDYELVYNEYQRFFSEKSVDINQDELES